MKKGRLRESDLLRNAKLCRDGSGKRIQVHLFIESFSKHLFRTHYLWGSGAPRWINQFQLFLPRAPPALSERDSLNESLHNNCEIQLPQVSRRQPWCWDSQVWGVDLHGETIARSSARADDGTMMDSCWMREQRVTWLRNGGRGWSLWLPISRDKTFCPHPRKCWKVYLTPISIPYL